MSGRDERAFLAEADGGSRGNPGPAGYGAVVRDVATGAVVAERAEFIGVETNNVAEYRGLIAALEAAVELGCTSLDMRMDSKLVIEQMAGRWQIKHPSMRPLARTARALVERIGAVTWTWIPRAQNSHADRLANQAMDAGTSSRSTVRAEVPRPASAAAASGRPTPAPSAPDETTTTLFLLRHGETEHSVTRRLSGRSDPPLTDNGSAQAAAAAERFAGIAPALVVTSPLRRAVATAEAVVRVTGSPLVVEPDLRELDFGDWEGQTGAEVHRRSPQAYARWTTSPDVAPPGGESLTDLRARVGAVVDRLCAQHAGERIVVVTHMAVVKTVLGAVIGAMDEVYRSVRLDLCSLSRVEVVGERRVVSLVNDISHLGPLG